jgi:hydrogenase nickel incorporation protein HypA/HybF
VHEFSLAQSILEIICSEAEKHQANHIIKVGVALGVISHVAPESLNYCFDLAKEGTPAGQAELVIRRVPLPASCADCGNKFTLHSAKLNCPVCGSSAVGILAEQELMIDYIEV